MREAGEGRRVARRRVFYIPGYDPFPPRRYRELYRREAAAQAAVSGHEIAVSARPGGDGAFGWLVRARIEGAPVETEVEVMEWSDIVRRSMSAGILGTYLALLRTAWVYAATGALPALMRLRKGPVIAALYPVAMLVGQLALALAAAWGAGRLIALALPPPWPWAGLALVWPVLALFRRLDRRLFAHYLLHDYAFSARWRGANPRELEARMAAFADRIAAALTSPGVDEVLVVGHSSGVHLGVSVLADLARSGRIPAGGPALGFLSLGQVVPMVSFLPGATRLRADLRTLSLCPAITWIDVSAPGDGCSFALCDPVAVSGVAPEGKLWPKVVSAAFTQTLSPATWRRLRRRFFRLHFQYLCAFDRPGIYDYFAITAGPRTLADRFAAARPSASRIERAASPHRAMAA
jgi:hypothetical protein